MRTLRNKLIDQLSKLINDGSNQNKNDELEELRAEIIRAPNIEALKNIEQKMQKHGEIVVEREEEESVESSSSKGMSREEKEEEMSDGERKKTQVPMPTSPENIDTTREVDESRETARNENESMESAETSKAEKSTAVEDTTHGNESKEAVLF